MQLTWIEHRILQSLLFFSGHEFGLFLTSSEGKASRWTDDQYSAALNALEDKDLIEPRARFDVLENQTITLTQLGYYKASQAFADVRVGHTKHVDTPKPPQPVPAVEELVASILDGMRKIESELQTIRVSNSERASVLALVKAITALVASPEPEWAIVINLLKALGTHPAITASVVGLAIIDFLLSHFIGS